MRQAWTIDEDLLKFLSSITIVYYYENYLNKFYDQP